jgi:hypothetical protein
MKLSKQYGLKPGDSLVHPIAGVPGVKHFGVFLGENHYGVELFAENQKFVGVRVLNSGDYIAANGAPERAERLSCSDQERYTAVRRALQEAGKPSDLVVYNCEHYARFVQTGSSTSNQVGNVLAGLLLGALVYCISAD